jgi:hypothetical protein
LGQVDFAKAIPLDENTIVNWERANRLPRQHAKLKHLFGKLGLDYAGTVDRFGPSLFGQPSFGVTLRWVRVRKGLTQARAARFAGNYPDALARREKSRT